MALQVFADGPSLAAAAASAVVAHAVAVTRAGRSFRLGLSGGRTPVELYRALADPRTGMDWGSVELFFADERAVPPTDPESNYWMVRKVLIEPAAIPPARVHRMRAEEEDLEAEAGAYEPLVAQALDLLVLGVGEDGHIASLFPGSAVLAERIRRVAAVFDSPKPPARRLTLTPVAIAEARAACVLATGSEKSRAVAGALEGGVEADALPARLVRERDWYLDRAAAAGLREAGRAG